MKSKKILTILLSLAIMFTFMPMMAFAATESHDYTSVTWASDFHSVTVGVKDTLSDGTVKTDSIQFNYMDPNGVGATKAEFMSTDPKYFVVGDENADGTTDFDLYQGTCVQITSTTDPVDKALVKAGYEYKWVINASAVPLTGYDTLTIGATTYNSEKPALDGTLFKTVYDASRMNVTVGGSVQKEITVDAGAYSAWYAQKDKVAASTNPANVTKVGAWTVGTDDAFFAISYPAYDAYEFDTVDGKKVDKELTIGITLNEAAIKAQYGNTVEVSTATGSVKLIPNVGTPSNDFYTDFYIEGNKPYNASDATTYNNNFTYDGKSHNIVFLNPAKEVTMKYFVAPKKADGTFDTPKTSDWVDTFPGIKDAGTYRVYVMITANKNNVSYGAAAPFFYEDSTVAQMPVQITRKQEVYNAEYGKFSEAELEAALKALFVAPTVPDSQDKVDEVISKYLKVTGLFTQAGQGTVNASLNDTDYKADTELAKAVANYKFEGTGTVANPGITLKIEKADNDLTIKTSAKTVKGVKKGKLKKNMSFKISYTVQQGTATFTKVSGNSKIKVSNAGKVTVKKGIKKGTYKLKVKAVSKGDANVAQATATKVIKIKVK